MNNAFWPLAVNTWGEEERRAAHAVIDSGRITMGSKVRAFEEEFAEYVGVDHAVMVNSGSSANLLATAAIHCLWSMKSEGQQEVIVPAIAWPTTYAPLQQYGNALRIVDVEPQTLNMSAAVARATSLIDPDKIFGIVGCSVLGNPADLSALREIADENGLWFLEDNCESFGATLHGQHCGTFGDVGTYSMFFSHHMNTCEGGMLVTDNHDLYEIALCMRAHGWTRDLPISSKLRCGASHHPYDYQFVLPGYNLRPTEIAAAVGSIQLRRQHELNAWRIANAIKFHEAFGSDERYTVQHEILHADSIPFGFTLVCRTRAECDEMRSALDGAGIEHRMITGGSFAMHAARRYYVWKSTFGTPHADHAHECGLFVGNHPFDLGPQIRKMRELLQ